MSFALQVVIFACYTLAAVGAGLALPTILPGLPQGANLVVAVLIFFGGVLAQEVIARRAQDSTYMRRLVTLKRAYDKNSEELALARDEVRRIYESLESTGRTGMPAPEARELREVASEVKVLHSLVEQLYSEGAATPAEEAEQHDPFEEDRIAVRRENRGVRARERGKSASEPGSNLRVVSALADDEDVIEIVKDGLRKDRVDLYVQPIVSLPQRKVRYFECFSRIRSETGSVVLPETYMALAKREGLISAIDNMLLFRSTQLLRRMQNQSFALGFFVNVSAHSLNDRTFFRDFIDYLEKHEELAPNVVLELTQSDLTDLNADTKRDLQRLARLGFRFSLDGIKDLALDVPTLTQDIFSFVKLDASLLLDPDAGDSNSASIRLLKQSLDEHGIDLVVEKIETEQTLVELLDFNIDYGQGFLFGEPRLSDQEETARALGD